MSNRQYGLKASLIVLERSGGRCWYCGLIIEASSMKPIFDHQIPLARGGSNTADNMVVACAACNGSKLARTVEEFREYLERMVTPERIRFYGEGERDPLYLQLVRFKEIPSAA